MKQKITLKGFAVGLVICLVFAVVLSPVIIYVVDFFYLHQPTDLSTVSTIYADPSAYIPTVATVLGDPTYRNGFLVTLLIFVLVMSYLLDSMPANTREVEDGILGDQHVFTRKGDILRRNYSWDGSGAPPVKGLAAGGFPSNQILFPATHAVIVAPSGSGKTRGSVYETIDNLSHGCVNSLIVTDPSGEIFAMMAKGLEDRGYKVALVDLDNSRRGSRFNPLLAISERYQSGDLSGAEARAREIGDIVCPETGGENDFFTRSAGGVLSAVCYLVASDDEIPDDLRTLWTVSQVIAKGTRSGTAKLKSYLSKDGEESAPYMMAQTFITATDKVENSILSSLTDALQAFSSADIKYLTSASDIKVSDVLDRPVALFLRTLPKGYQQNKLVSLFLAQHLSETLRRGDRGNITPTYIIGDEFHAVPRFDLVTAVEQGRKYGLHYYMYVQSLTAFDTFSTRNENGKEAVLANADVKVLYKAGSKTDAEYFETLGGKRTIHVRNSGMSVNSQNSKSASEGFSEREILNWPQGDLLARDPVQDGICIFSNIYGESKHNGKFEIPVPDVTKTPTAAHFSSFGTRDHEAQIIASVDAELNDKAASIPLLFKAWTPPIYDSSGDDAASESDSDVFGV